MTQKARIKKFLPISLLFVTFVAIAAIVTIDAADAAYRDLSNVQGTNISTGIEVRTAAGFQLAGAYRMTHGATKLPQGSEFKVIWHVQVE